MFPSLVLYLPQGFNRRNVFAFRLRREQRARIHRHAVDENGACPARAVVAAMLDAEIAVGAQDMQKGLVGRNVPGFQFSA